MSALEIGRPSVARSATAHHGGTLVVLAATLVMAMGTPASSSWRWLIIPNVRASQARLK
jgi:hypothetical protein